MLRKFLLGAFAFVSITGLLEHIFLHLLLSVTLILMMRNLLSGWSGGFLSPSARQSSALFTSCPNTISTRSCGTLKDGVFYSLVIFQLIEPNVVGFAWETGVEGLWIVRVPFEILCRVTVPWETAKVV